MTKTPQEIAEGKARGFLAKYNPMPYEEDVKDLAQFILKIEADCLKTSAQEIDDSMQQSESNGPGTHPATHWMIIGIVTKFLRGKAYIREQQS